jgi:protein-tyrosine phosphatase
MAASWQESEIIAGLFVGDLQDAQKFDGTIISVLPDVPEGEPPQAIHMPFLAEGVVTLDQTATLIDEELARGHRVLVHCEEGCERAPLVVAWFLKTKRGMTIDAAYALLKSRRPIVEDRRRWLGIHNR